MQALRLRVTLEIPMDTREEPTEMVGKFRFCIQPAERTPEYEARWNDRVEALAELLLELWEIEQQQMEAKAA